MNKHGPLKDVVTVTEMARMCNLSRARFYQLMQQGVFPSPLRNRQTGRPYFDRELQDQCLSIRRTNRGANGKTVMFYGLRPIGSSPSPANRKLFPKSKAKANMEQRDPVIVELRHGLAQLGSDDVTDLQVRQALLEAYPDGHGDVSPADKLRAVFEVIQRRNSADNLSG